MPASDLEAQFLTNLPTIDKILGLLARRHLLQPADAEEFASWAKMRLIEDNYAILAKFRGESSIATYLTVVLSMLYREYRVAEMGRWRPSAAAKRLGSLAVRLETLTGRDGLSIRQAAEHLRTLGVTELTDRRLAALAATFPRRGPLRPVSSGLLPADATDAARADQLVDAEESTRGAQLASDAVREALTTLPAEDGLLVRLHYIEGMSLADIARGLDMPQKPLYRRMEKLVRTLRSALERSGVSHDYVRELASGPL